MSQVARAKLLAGCAACFLLGWLAGGRGPDGLAAGQPPAKAAAPPAKNADAPPLPMPARLGANVYLMTAAEYRACCHGIYQGAALRLEAVLRDARPRPANPAAVMDLDETVLDNSAFQTFLYRNNLEYTDALWADYEEHYPQDVTLIPGAKDFIHRAEALGVRVVFISNRSEAYKKATASALERLDVSGTNLMGRLYLNPTDGSPDKSARRKAVAARYNVLMYFGDNLRDFSEAFENKNFLPKDKDPTQEDYQNAIARRAAAADDARVHWGIDWFVLPNPVYGEWDRLTGKDPKAVLHPTTMKPKKE